MNGATLNVVPFEEEGDSYKFVTEVSIFKDNKRGRSSDPRMLNRLSNSGRSWFGAGRLLSCGGRAPYGFATRHEPTGAATPMRRDMEFGCTESNDFRPDGVRPVPSLGPTLDELPVPTPDFRHGQELDHGTGMIA